MRTLAVPLALIVALLAAGCKDHGSVAFHADDFVMPDCALVLGFDLRDDRRPIAGLSINEAVHPTGVQNIMVLPFPSRAVELNAHIVATAGQYRDFTFVSYAIPYAQREVVGIGLLPVLAGFPERLLALDDLPPGVYLDYSGLDRTFIYHYAALDNAVSSGLGSLQHLSVKLPDAVAVALPRNASGREIRDGRTEIPAHIHQTTIARFYPSTSGDPGVKALQIRYEVPASAGQKRLAKIALKFLAAVITPLVGLMFLPGKDTTRPRARKIGIGIILSVEILILISLIVLWVRSPSEIHWQLLEELPAIMAGALVTGIALWVKK